MMKFPIIWNNNGQIKNVPNHQAVPSFPTDAVAVGRPLAPPCAPASPTAP